MNLRIANSPLISGIIGVLIGSLISFYAIRYQVSLQAKTDNQTKIEDYKNILNTTYAFIQFYNGYYNQLALDLESYNSMYSNVPSDIFAITLTPDILNECITELISFKADSVLTRQIFGCYYDMKNLQDISNLYLDYIFTDYTHIKIPPYEIRVAKYFGKINEALSNSDKALKILRKEANK